MNGKMVYLDNAGTTPVAKEVLEAMQPYFSEKYGNASSLHGKGREAKRALEESRTSIAKFLNVDSNEIYFTSGATESNNLAVKGMAFANRNKGKHIIISKIEHPCIIESGAWLAKQGFEVTKLPVDQYGFVDPAELERSIRKDTILVSVMTANNEIGTVEPVTKLAKICNDRGVAFHTDAVQAYGKIPMDLKEVGMLSASSHKIYGPKGVGMLMVRHGIKLEPLISGGGHERGLRSGTENVAGVVGFAAATELMKKEMPNEGERQTRLRDKLIKETLKLPETRLNGHPTKRLPNNANFSFAYIEGESLILRLDDAGIMGSTGSACSSPKLEPSHVLLSIGLPHALAHGSLRLTMGRNT
ncbi:MAG: cysteine desulfurase family protein, partial [Candidatus Aenigmatarchaeota archaeon]